MTGDTYLMRKMNQEVRSLNRLYLAHHPVTIDHSLPAAHVIKGATVYQYLVGKRIEIYLQQFSEAVFEFLALRALEKGSQPLVLCCQGIEPL